jgi:hypothetical protein
MIALESWTSHGGLLGCLGGGRSVFKDPRLREGSVRLTMRRGCGRTCSAPICGEGSAGAETQWTLCKHCDRSAVGAKAALPAAAKIKMTPIVGGRTDVPERLII